MELGNGFIAIDWGTTNRRVYTIDAHGRCVASLEDDNGIMAFGGAGFEAEMAGLRERLGDRPILLAGMIGSDRGWRQAPYVSCPAGLSDIARAVLWIEPGRVGIVPGVSQRTPHPDVMRGEEVQAFGAMLARQMPDDGVICHPGTHTKWMQMTCGRIDSFTTVMTGEIFGLLQRHSILASQLAGDVTAGPAFDAGVVRGLSGGDLLAELFTIRARHLLEGRDEDSADYASGLLIGANVRGAIDRHPAGPVTVLGRPELCALYSAALTAAGRESHIVDGAGAFVAGMAAIAEQLA